MIRIMPLSGLPEICPGDDIAAILAPALSDAPAETGDIVVATQKIFSKAEMRFATLCEVKAGEEARKIAAAIGKDERLVELILSESSAVVRAVPGLMIVRHNTGHVMANAGIDESNIGPGGDGRVLLLPEDPDASVARLGEALEARLGIRLGIVMSDSFGRPWRNGVVNVAIGAWGMPALADWRGSPDRDGRELQATEIAYADQIASAAGLAMGEADEGVPAVLIKGARMKGPENSAAALIRPADKDLYR